MSAAQYSIFMVPFFCEHCGPRPVASGLSKESAVRRAAEMRKERMAHKFYARRVGGEEAKSSVVTGAK